MEPGVELDIAIAELMGYSVLHSRPGRSQRRQKPPLIPELGFQPCPRFSTRMSDAWKLADYLWQNHRIATSVTRGLMSKAVLQPPGGLPVHAFHRKAPHAICLAAIEYLSRN